MNDTLAREKGFSNDVSDRLQLILTLGFNAIPLTGVTFWGWSAFELIFLYWLKNVGHPFSEQKAFRTAFH